MPADPSTGDGLDELQAARLSRQNRRPPTPKRSRTPKPPEPTTGEGTASSGRVPPPAAPAGEVSVPAVAPPTTPSPAAEGEMSPVQADDGPLTLVQVRVTEAQLDYLDEIEAVAATRRLDVTDAAVIRLALSRLMAAHTADQIVEHLGRPKVRGRRGRPRH